ncbi:MAG TPA: hypothetical protein PKA16_15615 [Ottowia sp.]|uniref:hypothetical protein n=1 Tax=Ottowia sp. TaxID=1898956 RepID=UPI002BCD1241|nr:hypothetical protein [Ottowia sp.]HMN22802.1 hypothetical protein [Ottowia sp.]
MSHLTVDRQVADSTQDLAKAVLQVDLRSVDDAAQARRSRRAGRRSVDANGGGRGGLQGCDCPAAQVHRNRGCSWLLCRR